MSRLRRHRTTLAIALGLAAGVAVVLLGTDTTRTGAALDPDNPDPGGAQALARVLAREGVDVQVVRDADALAAADAGPGTTVLVTSTDLLGRSTTRRLLDDTRGAHLVLARPGPGTTEALGVRDLPYQVRIDSAREGDCADPAYDDLSLEVDRGLEYPVAGGCFRGRHGALLAEPRPGVVLLGAADALSNRDVLRADDAALALRLLGQDPRLVWYVPSLDDLVADDGVSLVTLLPGWLGPSLLLLAIAVTALLVWRARRLGPLATEPLPVVVKAVETTRSRGRLYRRAGDRAHAAAVLRAASRARAAEHLGLGTTAGTGVLLRDLAHHVGRPLAEVDALLSPSAPPPPTDHDLIVLAQRLAEIDREVRRP